jgi:hypothetical protein
MGLGDQLAGGEAQGLLQAAELFVAGGIGYAAGLDQGEIRLGNAGAIGQIIQREPHPAALAAKFWAQSLHSLHR